MNLPPRNTSAVGDPNAGVFNDAPNSPITPQVETATGQQGAREAANAAAQAPQDSAAMTNQILATQAGQSTAQAAADAQLNYQKAVLLDRAGLTQGAQTMANLAQRYAPQGGDLATITDAIREGIGV